MNTLEALNNLQPTLKTITSAIDVEENSMQQLLKMVKNSELDRNVSSELIKILGLIAKMRINQRAEVSVKAKIIRDLSSDKEEMKVYIEATFPKSFRK